MRTLNMVEICDLYMVGLEAILKLVASLPLLVSIVLYNIEWRKYRDELLLFLQFAWSSLYLIVFIDGLSVVFQSEFLFRAKVIPVFPLMLFLEISMSKIMTDRINSVRIAVAASLAVFNIYTAFIPENVDSLIYSNGETSLRAVGSFRTSFLMMTGWISLTYLYYGIMLYKNTSGDLKKYALGNLVGIFMYTVVAFLIYAFHLNWIIPGLQIIPMGLGVLISSYFITKRPELLYSMPFKMQSLMIIQKSSGNMIYSYDWSQNDVNPIHIASLLESISLFGENTMGMGRINLISFENGMILLRPLLNTGFYIVVLCSSYSPSLARGLERFSQQVIDDYQKSLLKGGEQLNAGLLNRANYVHYSEFIKSSFPYIPTVDVN